MTYARILCVDDDPKINELNQIVLTRAGFEVLIASSPEDALQQLQASPFDLLITDLFTPPSVGAEFVSKLRHVAPKLPIILVSGNHNPAPEILEQVNAFVPKAYSLSALRDAVHEALAKEKLRRIG